MPNKYTAPEMYRHMLNGRAWVKHLDGYRQIQPKPIVAAKKIDGRKYPLLFRSINDLSASIDENTNVVNADDEKYWRLADVVIFSGYDLNKFEEKPWREGPDKPQQ